MKVRVDAEALQEAGGKAVGVSKVNHTTAAAAVTATAVASATATPTTAAAAGGNGAVAIAGCRHPLAILVGDDSTVLVPINVKILLDHDFSTW